MFVNMQYLAEWCIEGKSVNFVNIVLCDVKFILQGRCVQVGVIFIEITLTIF